MQIISADMKDEDTLCCGRELFNCKRLLEKKERYNSALKYTESNKSIHILQFPNTLHIKLQFFKKLS
jgi:hypothetical protein